MSAGHSMEGYFCPRPFEFATIGETGTVYLCCPGWLKVAAGSMDHVTFEEVWNSNYAQAMRQSILDGSYSYCNDNCPYIKTRAGIIKRNDEVTDPWHREIIDKGLTKLDRGPREMTVSHDPTCNLTCPSCRREMFYHEPGGKERSARIHEQIFNQAITDTELIEICGNGDPFASPLYLDALRNFDRTKYPKLRIGLVTNGLRLDRKMWDSIASVHGRIKRIHISWNGARPETFAENQRGGQLEKLLENMAFIAELRASGEIPFMSFGFYVQRNNFREMPEMLPLAKQFNADAIYFTPVSQTKAHTEAEFADHAVHRPGHPEFPDFREVLNSPAMNDPLVHLINIEHLLYADVASAPTVAGPATSFGDLAEGIEGPFTFAAFAALLRLDEASAERVRFFLNRMKDLSVILLAREPLSGEASPLTWLAATRKTGVEGPDAEAGFRDYALSQIEPDSGANYWAALRHAVHAAYGWVYEHLSVVQRRFWDCINLHTLLDVDTGYNALELSLGYRLDERATLPWAEVLIRLDLHPLDDAAIAMLVIITEHDRALRTLLSRPTAEGGPTPYAWFGAMTRLEGERARAAFLDYLGRTPAEGGASYVALMRDLQDEKQRRLLASMPAFASEEVVAWLSQHELRSGDDPSALAMDAAVEGPAPQWRVGGPWEETAEALQLSEAQCVAVTQILRDMKEQVVATLRNPSPENSPSPLEVLAQGVASRDPKASAKFTAQLAVRERSQDKTYAQLLQRYERRVLQEFETLLTPEQVLLFRNAAPLDASIALRIPDDPFQHALRDAVKRLTEAALR